MDADNANQPEWKAWITKSYQATKDFEKTNKLQQDSGSVNDSTRMRDYLEEVLALLKEKKAKTWNELHPDAERVEDEENNDDTPEPQKFFFDVWSSDWRTDPVPQEKAPLYEELYEACWNGDDDKICKLCLPPPEGTTRKVAPIQIVCRANEGGKASLSLTLVLFNTDATVYRVHPTPCCDPSSSLDDSEYCYDDRCRSAEDKARGHYRGRFQDIEH